MKLSLQFHPLFQCSYPGLCYVLDYFLSDIFIEYNIATQSFIIYFESHFYLRYDMLNIQLRMFRGFAYYIYLLT